MREEEASLMLIQHAIDELGMEKKAAVMACVSAIRDVMQRCDEEHASLALMLVAAEVAAA